MPDFLNLGAQVTNVIGSVLSGQNKNVSGPLASLYTNKFKLGKMSYPIDLGSGPFVHWIQFNILKSTGTTKLGVGGVQIDPSVQANINPVGKQGYGLINDIVGKVDSAIGSFSGLGSLIGAAGGSAASFFAPGRRVRQSQTYIQLYIPNQVVFNQGNQYSDVSLTQQLGLALTGAQLATTIKNDESVAPYLASAGANLAGLDPNFVLNKTVGLALNPQYEVIFQQTDLRTFQFEFVLVARSKAEQGAINDIIKAFRTAAAPRIDGSDGRFLVPPDEFDISFYFNGGQNEHIPRISTCVLTNLITDLAPSGQWSTFDRGQPVATRLTLQFKEVELIHQDKISQGF